MKTILLAGLIGLIALPALAEKNPQPKPSGVVIHIFGPTLLSTSATQSQAGTTATTAPAGTTSSPNLTLGQVVHELFVTGDPAQDSVPHFPRGRAASDHP